MPRGLRSSLPQPSNSVDDHSRLATGEFRAESTALRISLVPQCHWQRSEELRHACSTALGPKARGVRPRPQIGHVL